MKANTELTTRRGTFYLPRRETDGSVQQEAAHRHQVAQEQFRRDSVEVSVLEPTVAEDTARIRAEEKKKKITVEGAKTEVGQSWWELASAFSLIVTSFALILTSLAPSFYGREWMAFLVCIGASMLGIWATHLSLDYSERIMTDRHHDIFIAVVTFCMLLFIIWGATYLSRSRALQSEIFKQSESVLSSDPALSADRTAAIERVDYYNTKGTVLFFLGAEWIGGLLLYRALRKKRFYGPLVAVAANNRRNRKRLLFLKKRIAGTSGKTPVEYLMEIIFDGRNRSSISQPLMIVLVAVFLGAIIFFVFLSERVHGADFQPSYSLIAMDVTGSRPEHEMREDDKGVVHFIMDRRPGDAGFTTVVTEGTFGKREVEYEVHFRMPTKIGYFAEELKKAKAEAVKEFLAKSQKTPKKRPGTSLIDGIFMYAKILREHDEKLKNLVFFSDMRQCAQGINEESIVKNSDQVIARLKSDGFIPNMKGIDVWCMGVSSNGLNVFQYQKIENFWRTFFSAAQANLRCYDFGRSRSID